MGIKGFQDHWVTGSRAYFRRDPIDGVPQPFRDLGVVEPANPGLTIEKLELEDSDGGTKSIVDEVVTKIDEQYDLVVKNLNLDNIALLFFSDPPEAFTRSQQDVSNVTVTAFPGALMAFEDATGDRVNGAVAVAALVDDIADLTLDVGTVTDIDAGAKTITVTGDLTTDLAVSDLFALGSALLTNVKNSRTYTVAAISFAAGDTTITTEETPAGSETGITGDILYAAVGDGGTIYSHVTDYETTDTLTQRGFVRILTGGALSSGDPVMPIFTLGALSGNRMIKPQSVRGEVQGDIELFWSRGNFAQDTVRRGRCSVTPNQASFTADDFSSMTLSVRMLSDLTAEEPAGDILQGVGPIPTGIS